MKTFTSASAAKYLRALQEEKSHLLRVENENSTYTLADGEKSEAPEYDYDATRAKVAEANRKELAVRHALHVFNNETVLPQSGLTIDEALIRLAMMSNEKIRLTSLRNTQPKRRVGGRWGSQTSIIEYEYANFDVAKAEADYLKLMDDIAALQLEIDLANQTIPFDVEI